MDPSPVRTTPPLEEEEDDDEWDNDGFVIPSLGIEEPVDRTKTNSDAPQVESSKPPSPKAKTEEEIYLGPHGAPPSQAKQQQEPPASSTRKQRFKQKLKEADRRIAGSGRENKVESLRELVGSRKVGSGMAPGSARDWLDPHCHESQFEKLYPQ